MNNIVSRFIGLLFAILLFAPAGFSQISPCAQMSCLGNLNLILDKDCNTEITPSLLLTGFKYADSQYEVLVRDKSGNIHDNAFDASDAGQRFSVTIINTLCNNLQCWGYVKIENKNIPTTSSSTVTTMCGAPDATFETLKDIAISLAESCTLPVTDIVASYETTGDKCSNQMSIRTVRGSVALDGKIQKVILRVDTAITTPLDTSMVMCPGNMDLLSPKRLLCEDLDGEYPSPSVVAQLMGDRMASPFVDKGLQRDSTEKIVKVNRDSIAKQKVLLDDGKWALFDVVTKYQIDSSYFIYDTTYSEVILRPGDKTCNLIVKYEDIVYESCVGEIGKIKRKWTILDWCGGAQKVCYQWILVTDDTAPVVELHQTTVLADVTPWVCSAEVDLSEYIKKAESCTDVALTYTTDGGVLNGSILSSLWLDESPVIVTITATNACGVQTVSTLTIKVHDMTAPVAIALDEVNVSLTGDEAGDGGIAKVTAETIDVGSHDSSCGEVTTCVILDEELQDPLLYAGYWSTTSGLTSESEITLAGSGTHLEIGDSPLFNLHGCEVDGYIYTYDVVKGKVSQTGKIPYVMCKDYVKFCCEDLGVHKVALVVSDDSEYSKSGVSWTNVKVEDKSAGQWYCISETVPCAYVGGFMPKELPRYGSDFCNQYEIREITRDVDVNTCGEGSIKIFYGAYDSEGDEVSTTECVFPLSGRKEFNPYEIKWPKHYTDVSYQGVSRECEVINDKGDKMIVEYEETAINMGGSFECSVMADTGGPVWCTEACGLIASSYEDEEIESGDACKKIVRKWTVIDWCTWEANGSKIDDENDTATDQFQAVDDQWLRVNEDIEDALTDSRVVSTVFVDGRRVTDLACEECEKPSGRVDDIYFRYKTVDEDGYYTYDQIIKIIDLTAPVIDVSADTVSIATGAQSKNDDFDDCVGSGMVTAVAVDICGVNTLVDASTLIWSIVTRDENDNVIAGPKQVIGATATMTTGTGFGGDVHEITWKVTDGCGNTAIEKSTVLFSDDKNPTPVCIQDLSTATMSTDGTVEIWATDFDRGSYDNCSEVKFAFLVDSDGDVTEDEDEGTLVSSVTFDCDDLTSGQSGTQELRMYVIDDFGNTDFCYVNLRIDDNADACPNGDIEAALIAGELRTEAGEMIESVEVNLRGGNNNSMNTPVDGNYEFAQNKMGRDYEIVPYKNGDYLNGVSTIDLVKIQRHILGNENLDSPYKIIAADVSNDNRISAIDLIHLRKMLLGVDTEFANNTSWRFVDADQEFENASNPWPFTEVMDIDNLSGNLKSEDFIGIKIGDVSGNAIANSALKAGGRSSNVIKFSAIDQSVTKGDLVEVSINSGNFDNIVGLQYTMDINGLKYTDITSGAIEITGEHVASLDDNTLTMAWYQPSAKVLDDATLFTMFFEATTDIVLSEALSISSRVTAVGAYNVQEEESDVTLTWESEYNLAGGMQLMQNQPNPFRKATDISFMLPQAGAVTLTIFDVTGKVVMNKVGDYNQGLNTITISKEALGVGSGILYYQLESNEEVATMKMIVVE